MKPKTILALLLIAIGFTIVIWQSIAWTTKEKEVDLGLVQITAVPKHSVPLLPVMGGMALGVGIFMLATDRRHSN